MSKSKLDRLGLTRSGVKSLTDRGSLNLKELLFISTMRFEVASKNVLKSLVAKYSLILISFKSLLSNFTSITVLSLERSSPSYIRDHI